MSLIKEYYQDEQGNWLPEALEVLKRYQSQTTTTDNGTNTLLPLDNLEGFCTELCDGLRQGQR
jgi:hypothetical protein